MSSNSSDRPIPLITVNNGKFEIGKEAYSILSKVKGKVGMDFWMYLLVLFVSYMLV